MKEEKHGAVVCLFKTTGVGLVMESEVPSLLLSRIAERLSPDEEESVIFNKSLAFPPPGNQTCPKEGKVETKHQSLSAPCNAEHSSVRPFEVDLSFLQDPDLSYTYDVERDCFYLQIGPLDKIVEWLIFRCDYSSAIEDLRVLLLHYRQYCSSEFMFDLLVKLYHTFVDWKLTQRRRRRNDSNREIENAKTRLFGFLKIWYESYPNDFKGGLTGKLLKFIKKEFGTDQSNVFKLLLLRNNRRSRSGSKDRQDVRSLQLPSHRRRASSVPDGSTAIISHPASTKKAPSTQPPPLKSQPSDPLLCSQAQRSPKATSTTTSRSQPCSPTRHKVSPRIEATAARIGPSVLPYPPQRTSSSPALSTSPRTVMAKFSLPSIHFTKKRSNSTPEEDKPNASTISGLNLADVHARDLAEQLTLLELELYAGLRPEDFVRASGATTKTIDNLTPIVRHFNKLSLWVATEIITAPSEHIQLKLYLLFIKTCQRLLQLENYQTLLAVISALSCCAVRRLKYLQRKLNGKQKDLLERLDTLLSPTNNYQRYRERCKEGSVGIPILPVLQRDLLFIDDGNENTIGEKRLINFTKLRMMSKGINMFLSLFKKKFHDYDCLRMNPNLYYYILSAEPLEEAELYAYSSRALAPQDHELLDHRVEDCRYFELQKME